MEKNTSELVKDDSADSDWCFMFKGPLEDYNYIFNSLKKSLEHCNGNKNISICVFSISLLLLN